MHLKAKRNRIGTCETWLFTFSFFLSVGFVLIIVRNFIFIVATLYLTLEFFSLLQLNYYNSCDYFSYLWLYLITVTVSHNCEFILHNCILFLPIAVSPQFEPFLCCDFIYLIIVTIYCNYVFICYNCNFFNLSMTLSIYQLQVFCTTDFISQKYNFISHCCD